METTIFHVFRNTPLGREILLQSLYFCQQTSSSIAVYIPQHVRFLMYYENDVVQVDLDQSYLTDPETAKEHAIELALSMDVEPRFITPKNFTASTLPDIPVDFDFMCCPRSISDLSTKISLGHIGPKVRRIINSARFPILMPSALFKEWESIIVFFGGSDNSIKALKLGLRLSQITGVPLDMFTYSGGGGTQKNKEHFVEVLREAGLEDIVCGNEDQNAKVREWYFFDGGKFEHNLYRVPHNALAVLGAYGHGVVKDVLFGSTMEMIQTILPNTLLIAGPNYVVPHP
ncbi:Putatite adenine nucleotide alpha hydrolases, UspA12 [Desulfamplus magnetovallimortis]|uniref:Putatite adenine nucleotide alpha hydrolases, UspA12 n=1 Tax=Desulfamplus magnetovallimortis TaxID=1246637 RepID=A0A1W1H4I4_9BACT|nr:universal stress protein UspA [Desulfamplus magnetovallimortis]SLM27381.1 Putatite adenine nucleotide alpha hydrolases, UspA12 [Desulfamplus magnetovallimortis]